MGRASLEGVELKLNRAADHLEELGQSIQEFLLDPEAYDLVSEFDSERRPILRVGDVRRPPPSWGVLIGDCVYNLHSALDHLAFQLAVANARGSLSRSLADTSAFPIFNSGPRFRATTRRGEPRPSSGLFKIRGTSRNVQRIIERLQPYHRVKNPDARRLWQLHELSNVDKHRLLHVTYSSLDSSRFRLTSADPMVFHGYEFWPGPLERNRLVARWRVTGGPGSWSVDIQAEMVTDIVFALGSPARSVRGESVQFTLHEIASFIARSVLPPLFAELGQEPTFSPGTLLDTTRGEVPPGFKPVRSTARQG